MDSDVKTFLIPNDLFKRSGVACSWIPINQIGVFPHQKAIKRDTPSAFASDNPTSIFHLRHEVILFTSVLRKLVNEANGTFLYVQTLHTADANEKRIEILKLSRQYRSIIRACLENLQDEILKKSQLQEEYQNYITIFYSVECIWHLCEILFIEKIPGEVILPHLLEWIRFHFPKYERNAAALLAGDLVGLETHSEYWETVIGSVLQGRIKVVRALLKQHSDSDTQCFQIVDQCLKAMPIYNAFGGVSASEFMIQRRQWIADVQSKIDAKLFVSCYNLNLIMKLVVGNEVAWGEIQQYCETWYELLAAWLFFTEPTIKSFELGRYAKQCITKMSIRNRMKHLDRVLLAAMEFNVLQVLKEIQQMAENGWFVTHLTDLLYHSGRLEDLTSTSEVEAENFSAAKLRESFVIDYGTQLMGHKSLWQVGLSYLDFCQKEGLKTIKLLLPRLSLDSELKAKKIVREALIRNLPDIARNICKVQGMIFKNKGRMGNALAWAIKSQDSIFISFLAEKFLREYVENGKFTNVDLLDNLGSCILASDRLIFLGKYYEFYKLYQNKEFGEAAKLLVSLMDSKIIPNYFWPILLIETIPLLECEKMVFSSSDTFLILQCLEEKEHLIELKDKLNIIRLAAARNLSRALIYEAQIK